MKRSQGTEALNQLAIYIRTDQKLSAAAAAAEPDTGLQYRHVVLPYRVPRYGAIFESGSTCYTSFFISESAVPVHRHHRRGKNRVVARACLQ